MEKINGVVEDVKFEKGGFVAVVDVDTGDDWFDIRIFKGKQIPNTFKYEADEEAAEKAEETCQDVFGLSFDDLKDAKGREVTVFYQEGSGKAYLKEPDWPIAFDKSVDPFTTKIERVHVGDDKITVHFHDPEGVHRALYYKWTEWRDGKPKKSRTKKDRQFNNFREKFGCDPEDGDELVGREINIEVANTKLNGKIYYFTKLVEESLSKKPVGNVTDTTVEALKNDEIPW